MFGGEASLLSQYTKVFHCSRFCFFAFLCFLACLHTNPGVSFYFIFTKLELFCFGLFMIPLVVFLASGEFSFPIPGDSFASSLFSISYSYIAFPCFTYLTKKKKISLSSGVIFSFLLSFLLYIMLLE